MKGTFTIAGHRVRTSSQRRYVVFAVRIADGNTHIIRRSDSAEKARYERDRTRFDRAVWTVVVIDTVTGTTV